MHQNAEERLELLHTISDIVGIEVEKRMDAFTDADHFSVRDASMAKPASGTLTTEQDKKEPYINNLSPQSVRNKRRDTNKQFINMTKKLLLLCALLISVITLSGAANRSFRTEMEQWNPIGFTQSQAGAQTTNLTAGSAILPTVATAAPSGELRGGSTNVITFTTARAAGEPILLYMEYSGDTPTLSGAYTTGIPKSGGKVTIYLKSQTVTIRGDVTFLDCFNNQLTALDVSKNTALTKLVCSNNQLTALDVSKNTALTKLVCSNNQLTALDVSKNTALRELECCSNQLTALDVSQNTALTSIDCYCNHLTTLDVSKNTVLTKLDCHNNQLTALDVSKNTALTSLGCAYNQLTTLDVSKNTALTSLNCCGNQIKGEEMTRLVNSLPDRTGKAAGKIVVVQSDAESNRCLKSDVAIAKSKNWNTQKYKPNTEEYVAYEGEDPIPYAVTLTKEGEGTLTATGAADLNAVPDGTELTIEATPADGYELKALTANGTDILATKKFTVTAATEVKATFTKKTFAVTFTKEGEGTITATDAADLNAVPFGTELTIVATPAAGYELKSLTANGADILATKKVVVKGATEVKAIFTKKTAAELVEAGTLCLYPNPAGTYVNVKAVKADALVRLYDANGTLRYEARTDADGTLQIDLSAYAEGTYLLRVGSDAQRLLIQR